MMYVWCLYSHICMICEIKLTWTNVETNMVNGKIWKNKVLLHGSTIIHEEWPKSSNSFLSKSFHGRKGDLFCLFSRLPGAVKVSSSFPIQIFGCEDFDFSESQHMSQQSEWGWYLPVAKWYFEGLDRRP